MMTESKKMDWNKVAETLRHERMLRPYADEYGAHADAALDLVERMARGELVEPADAVEAYKRTLAPPADEATVDELEHCERVSQELFLIPVPQRVSIIARERAAAVEAYKRTLAPVANIRAALNTFATTAEAEAFVQEQVAAADRVGYERGRAEAAREGAAEYFKLRTAARSLVEAGESFRGCAERVHGSV